MQRAALGAVLHVPLKVGCGHRVHLIIKISLDAQGLTALHGLCTRARRCLRQVRSCSPAGRASRTS